MDTVRDRHFTQIDRLVEMTLKGQISSKEQIAQHLQEGIEVGTGELFERSLGERLAAYQQAADTERDELKQAKAQRRLRAVKTIQTAWALVQTQRQATSTLKTLLGQIVNAEPQGRLLLLLQHLDPNQAQPFNREQLRQLEKALADLDPAEFAGLAQGVKQGLATLEALEPHLVGWIYDSAQGALGFAGVPGQRQPWASWRQQVQGDFARGLLETLAFDRSVADWAAQQPPIVEADWLAWILTSQFLQRGLVAWFDQQAYNTQAGPKLSIATFLTFATLWGQLAQGCQQAMLLDSAHREAQAQLCFQVTLQILRQFAQQTYFPLYGGIFASFSGAYLRLALAYLDAPLRQVAGTAEKARILTLLGTSQQVLGHHQGAQAFHQQALDIARQVGDRACEIANLNHLSRLCVTQKDYPQAIDHSQRALLLSRQTGDQRGEANALSNLGYGQVFAAQQLEVADPEVYARATTYLEQGLKLAQKLADVQSVAFCQTSLGLVQLWQGAPEQAVASLMAGLQAAQQFGDLYLQGLNWLHLGEALRVLGQVDAGMAAGQPSAIAAASLGMYLLHQLQAPEWRQAAGLLTILRGELGTERFQQILSQARSQIMAVIGVDGFDALPELLNQY